MVIKLSVVCKKQSNGSYFAICPDLKSCYTQGDTYEQALENLKELANINIKEEKDETLKTELIAEKINIFSEITINV